jgi:hypothetical protein
VSRSRSPRPRQDRALTPADPGHACADPGRCTRPFCAAPVDIRLIPPQQTRLTVHDLPGWPQSASALFDRLNGQITRSHLLRIAGHDPFGAHLHLADIAAQLVDSCLTLGGDMPELAEKLLAWRAVSEAREDAHLQDSDHRHPDRVAALAILVLRAATVPADTRIDALARTMADESAAHAPLSASFNGLTRLRDSVSARLWRHLVDTVLAPLRPTHPNLDRLINSMF